MKKCLFTSLFLICLALVVCAQVTESPVKGKTICIDPGHGGTALTDHYRVGPTGEREEWINLRVALMLKRMLEARGGTVFMTRTEDVFVSLTDRSKLCLEKHADVFISIHHNATADSSVNFPILYFHGYASENEGSVALGKLLGQYFVKTLYKGKVLPDGNVVSLTSDFAIFPDAGASVLRNTYGIPAILAEASFFTNQEEEQLLKTEDHNRREALAYLEALEALFSEPVPAIAAKNSKVPAIPAFKAFQEAERMTPVAKQWKQDYHEAEALFSTNEPESLSRSYELFTRSARSFPDSYLAAKCHHFRSRILLSQGKKTEAGVELKRAAEFYVTVPGL